MGWSHCPSIDCATVVVGGFAPFSELECTWNLSEAWSCLLPAAKDQASLCEPVPGDICLGVLVESEEMAELILSYLWKFPLPYDNVWYGVLDYPVQDRRMSLAPSLAPEEDPEEELRCESQGPHVIVTVKTWKYPKCDSRRTSAFRLPLGSPTEALFR